ncbi:MAG: hypothetical protein LBC73_09100 [Oscillospiraceae bacterium]|jgi:hypothetical protein|nr:hypothetical protein [Oscillospiraceae bacterium]
MFERIDNLRMTDIEAARRYPDNYYAMRKDSMTSQMGTLLFVGDNASELLKLVINLDDPTNYGIGEGLHLRRSLGGVVVGG